MSTFIWRLEEAVEFSSRLVIMASKWWKREDSVLFTGVFTFVRIIAMGIKLDPTGDTFNPDIKPVSKI